MFGVSRRSDNRVIVEFHTECGNKRPHSAFSGTPMLPDLSPETLAARYGLLARAVDPLPQDPRDDAVHQSLENLRRLIGDELLSLARLGSPDDFTEIYLGFQQELDRFAEFCAYPPLARRALIAFGGGYSAGKSSLVNALLGVKLMPVQIDPTTVLPAYVLSGEADGILALNLHAQRIPLSGEELASLTHEERERYGIQAAQLLRAAFVIRQNFPWPQLAFIDTPGYSAGKEGQGSDAARARAQLDAAQAVVWVASINQGTLSEEDIRFLAALRRDQPRLIVLSQADKKTPEDVAKIVEKVRDTLAQRAIPAVDVIAVSARKRQSLDALAEHLAAWQGLERDPRFAHRFKALFVRYARGIEGERREAERQRHYLTRLLALVDEAGAEDGAMLRAAAQRRIDRQKTLLDSLAALSTRFFGELKKIGDAVDVPLPEPKEIELIAIGGNNLAEQITALRAEEKLPEMDAARCLSCLMQAGKAVRRDVLIRRKRPGPAALHLLLSPKNKQPSACC